MPEADKVGAPGLDKDYEVVEHAPAALPGIAARLLEVARRNEDFYLLYTRREEMEPKLRHTRSIYLTKPKQVDFRDVRKTSDTADLLECEPTGLYRSFQPAIDEALDALRAACGVTDIGRVFITKLLAKTRIDPHVDQGVYFRHYHRYHFPLFTAPGCTFTVGDTSVDMATGRIYAINNCKTHSVQNDSDVDRVHLIVDAR